MPQQLSPNFYAAPQISTSDIASYKEASFDLIISNRPDNEAPSQPLAQEIEAAARESGIAFAHLPVTANGVSREDLERFLKEIDGKSKVLGFCKSGMRSVMIRSMALAHAGANVTQLITEAENAGFNIEGQRAMLESLTQ